MKLSTATKITCTFLCPSEMLTWLFPDIYCIKCVVRFFLHFSYISSQPFLIFCIDFLIFFTCLSLIFTGGIKCVVRERHMRPRGVIGSHALSLNQSDFFCICFYFSSHPFPIFWHWFSHFLTVYHSLLSLFPIWHNPACFCYCMFHIPINPNQSDRISRERRPFAGRRAIEYKSCSRQCPQHYLSIQIYQTAPSLYSKQNERKL